MGNQDLEARRRALRETRDHLKNLLEMYEAIPASDKPETEPNAVRIARSYLENYRRRRELFSVIKC